MLGRDVDHVVEPRFGRCGRGSQRPGLGLRALNIRFQGRLSCFTSGPENPHRVRRVTGGTRYALTIAFTCNPASAIALPGGDRPTRPPA